MKNTKSGPHESAWQPGKTASQSLTNHTAKTTIKQEVANIYKDTLKAAIIFLFDRQLIPVRLGCWILRKGRCCNE